MFTDREKKIIKLFIENENISLEFLSSILDVSTRTIRRDIDNIRQEIGKFNLFITFNKGKGYSLQHSKSQLSQLLSYLELSEQNKLELRIFLDILESDFDYFELETRYMYSESTIKSKVNDLKNILAKYDLGIKVDEGLLKVIGSEEYIRKFLYDNYFYFSNNILASTALNGLYEDILSRLRNLLANIFIQENMSISDADFSHIQAILLVSIYRHMNVDEKSDFHKPCFLIDTIIDKVNDEFEINLDDYERAYICANSIFEEDEINVLSRIKRLIYTSIEKINLQNNNYYKLDDNLEETLIEHIKLLIKRSLKNTFVQNPLLDEIKQKYFLEFNDALIFSEEIFNEFNVKLTESEIGYLAIYLMAINNKEGKNKRVVLICNYGLGTSQILKLKLEKELEEIDVIGVYPSAYLDLAMTLKPDLVISTVNLKDYNYEVPLIEAAELLVDSKNLKLNIFNKIGLKKLLEDKLFFDIEAKEKRDFFSKAFSMIKEKIDINDNILESIVERESMSSTYISNMAAIPHTIKEGDFKSFVAIFRLKDPIIWSEEQVRFIFMIVLNNKDKGQIDSLKMLYEYIFDAGNFNKMLNAKKIEDVVKEII